MNSDTPQHKGEKPEDHASVHCRQLPLSLFRSSPSFPQEYRPQTEWNKRRCHESHHSHHEPRDATKSDPTRNLRPRLHPGWNNRRFWALYWIVHLNLHNISVPSQEQSYLNKNCSSSTHLPLLTPLHGFFLLKVKQNKPGMPRGHGTQQMH